MPKRFRRHKLTPRKEPEKGRAPGYFCPGSAAFVLSSCAPVGFWQYARPFMATDEKDPKDESSPQDDEQNSPSEAAGDAGGGDDAGPADADGASMAPPELSADAPVEALAPNQMGNTRFVYGAFFAGAILIGFLATKIVSAAWHKLSTYKPQFGEPRDEFLYPISALIGIGVALYYFRKPSARQYAEEVASELGKVTWPSKKEVTNSTTVVVVTTIAATIFFALLDQFWRFITDKVYGV